MASSRNAKVGRTYQGVTSNITVAPYILSAKQISDWVHALNVANNSINPQRRKLLDLFNRVELDGQVETVTNLRTIAITNKQINFILKGQEGKQNEALLEQIRSPWFSKMLTFAMQARFWGHSLIEFKPVNGIINDAVLVPRTNVNPDKEMFFPNYAEINNNNGILYNEQPESNYCFGVHGTRKLGLFSIMAPYVLYKAGALGDLAQFCELFAIPFREVKYNPFDGESRKLAQQAMEEMGSAGYVILPQGTEFVIHDTKGTTSGSMAPLALMNFCDEQIGKVCLGGTMTTDNGSSRSQAEVHYEVKGEINLNDMIWIEYLLNWEVKPRFLNFGIPVAEGKFEFDKTREIPLETRIEMDVQVATQVPIAPAYWYHTYGIPEPKAGEIIKVPSPDKKEKAPGDGGAKGEKKKLKLSDQHLPECGHDILLADVPEQDKLATAFEQAVAEIYNHPHADQVPLALFQQTAKTLLNGLMDNWNKPITSIAYDSLDNALIAHLRSNIFAFSAAKSYTMYKDFGNLLLDNKDNIKSLNQFKSAIKEKYGQFDDTYIRAEYNHAIASGQSASFWADAWAHKDQFPNLQWVTAGDARVRPSHAALNGITRPIDDTFWDGHPVPLEWACRCQRIQINSSGKLTDKKEALSLASDIKVPKYFKNSGKTGVIWSDEHPYFTTGDPYTFGAVKNYGMQTVEKKYIDPGKFPKVNSPLDTTHKVVLWKHNMINKLSAGDGFALPDQFGNKILFDKEFLNKIINTKKGRASYLSELENVLSNPDEIWDNKFRDGKSSLFYIKYYQEAPIVLRVNPELKTGTIRAYTYYQADENKIDEGLMDNYRRGILLHKKTAK